MITCSISGLTAAATVTFQDSTGTVISSPPVTDYVVNDGSSSFTGGSQEATLTLKPDILRAITSPATYKCLVKSGKYPASLAQENSVTVTMLTFGKYEINPLNYYLQLLPTRFLNHIFSCYC